jgi:hypothetical protein
VYTVCWLSPDAQCPVYTAPALSASNDLPEGMRARTLPHAQIAESSSPSRDGRQ